MSVTDTVQIGSRTVTVRELRPLEVRQYFETLSNGKPVDPYRRLMVEACSLDDLAMMTDCTADELEADADSDADFARLVAVCKRLNPFFFRVRAAMDIVAREMDASSLLWILTGYSPSSPAADIPTS